MSTVRDLLGDVADQLDHSLLHRLYASVSAPTDRVRLTWRRAGWAFMEPGRQEPPLHELDRTADRVIAQACFGASAVGGLAGLGGLATVPPEVLASVVGLLRLAQRLALVYGFDPQTDRGQMAVWQALAAGLQLELPEGGAKSMRVRDLPRVMLSGAPPPNEAGLALAQGLFLGTLRLVGGRLSRMVPVLSSGAAAVSGRRRAKAAGQRMKATLRRLTEAPQGRGGVIEDAVEVA